MSSAVLKTTARVSSNWHDFRVYLSLCWLGVGAHESVFISCRYTLATYLRRARHEIVNINGNNSDEKRLELNASFYQSEFITTFHANGVIPAILRNVVSIHEQLWIHLMYAYCLNFRLNGLRLFYNVLSVHFTNIPPRYLYNLGQSYFIRIHIDWLARIWGPKEKNLVLLFRNVRRRRTYNEMFEEKNVNNKRFFWRLLKIGVSFVKTKEMPQ